MTNFKNLNMKGVLKFSERYKPFVNLPWPLFMNIFDTGSSLYSLSTNLSLINEEFDLLLCQKKEIFDVRIFIPQIKKYVKPKIEAKKNDKAMNERLNQSKLGAMSSILRSNTMAFEVPAPIEATEFLAKVRARHTANGNSNITFKMMESTIVKMVHS
jgi:hypothetical protein